MKIRIGLLALMLLLGVSHVQAEVCKDALGNEVPGYVKADCANENARFADLACGISNAPATITSSSGGTTQTTTATSTNGQGSAACAAIEKDLKACEAQCVPKVTNGSILPGPKDGSTARKYLLGNFLPHLTNSFLIFNMIVGVILLVVSGIMWIMATGNPDLKEKAQNTIVWAIIGLGVSMLAYVAVQIVININFFA